MHALASPPRPGSGSNSGRLQGATSFKAYMHLTRAELAAGIKAAHALGLPITGHLCAVTYREAAELGVDDLEHGFIVDTRWSPARLPTSAPPAMTSSRRVPPPTPTGRRSARSLPS